MVYDNVSHYHLPFTGPAIDNRGLLSDRAQGSSLWRMNGYDRE